MIFDLILSLLFPRRCFACGKFGKYFCEKCTTMILHSNIVKTAICPICKRPSFNGESHQYCRTKYKIDGLASVFQYRNEIKKTIKTIKYKRASDIADELSGLTIQALKENKNNLFASINRFIEVEKPILVPIPLHWWKKRSRWFNQAEVLGKYFAGHFNLQGENNLLIRKKLTKSQTELKLKQREENVKGIFSLNPNCLAEPAPQDKLPLANYSFLLFDDIWTTGATMREAANILKRAGAKKVWGLTLAR